MQKDSIFATNNTHGKAFTITCAAGSPASIVALIDTGASTNFVSSKFIQALKLVGDGVIITPASLILRLANQQTITTLGKVTIQIKIVERIFSVDMFIVDQLAYPLILGCEFLRNNSISLKFDDISDQLVLTHLQSLPKPEPHTLWVHQKTTIPAFSQ